VTQVPLLVYLPGMSGQEMHRPFPPTTFSLGFSERVAKKCANLPCAGSRRTSVP
jgi:hypothetical protein